MTNNLIQSRDHFTENVGEARIEIQGRVWAVTHQVSDGPGLVLLPGTLGRGDIFWNQMEALSGRAHILSLTYPESGGIEQWVDDIAALMDQAGMQSATILGSSLGGYVAQHFAGKYGNRVDRLIAANTLCSVLELANMPPYSFDLDTAPISKLRGGFENAMDAALKQQPEIADLVELLLLEVKGRISEQELRNRLKALKNAPELSDVTLGADQIITIESADDPLIPEPMRKAVRNRLEPAGAYRFLSGGHFPYITRATEYTMVLETCLGLRQVSHQGEPGAMQDI